jgi:hypothetical protein
MKPDLKRCALRKEGPVWSWEMLEAVLQVRDEE